MLGTTIEFSGALGKGLVSFWVWRKQPDAGHSSYWLHNHDCFVQCRSQCKLCWTSFLQAARLRSMMHRMLCSAGVNKKHQKFIFEYWAFSQKTYLNMWCFEKSHNCIPKIQYLHTNTWKSAYHVNFQTNCFFECGRHLTPNSLAFILLPGPPSTSCKHIT